MSIWAIADIHGSRLDTVTGKPKKPMDVFGEVWIDHLEQLEQAWQALIKDHDTVIIAGDIDWALHLVDAADTLGRLASWNGTKLLVRGNHDYWWSSKSTTRIRAALPASVFAIHNNCFEADGYSICGTKGSPLPGSVDWDMHQEKILNRELGRLRASLSARARMLPTIAALHYPPFYHGQPESPYVRLLQSSNVEVCVYGHLHGEAAQRGPQGMHDGIEYRLVAGDSLQFAPVLVRDSADKVDNQVPGMQTRAVQREGTES